MAAKFTFYSFNGSQWAGVGDLAIAEKGFTKDDFETKYIDLGTGENFNAEYLSINPNGTIPSLTSPSLDKPLTESTDILRYLDGLGTKGVPLVPTDPAVKQKVQAIHELVHSRQVDTNVILLQSRDAEELKKQQGGAGGFLANRQAKLDKEAAANPSHAFYGPKAKENLSLHKFYASPVGPDHEAFFKATHDDYRTFAKGMDKFDSLLALPYAAGDAVTEADFHAIPWLSHAMASAGTPKDEILNLSVLEKAIQKSAPDFAIGDRTKQWWNNVSKLESFKKVFYFIH